MPIEPSPRRDDYKTRKEYRFAHKKVKRNNMKQPVVIATVVVAVLAYAITKSAAVCIISAIVTAIVWVAWVRPWWNRQIEQDAKKAAERTNAPRYKVACPKCSAALTAPAGNGIKCPECGFDMKVTPKVEPTVAVDSTVGEIERLAGLHAQGALSDAEFAAAKGKVLG